MCPDVEDRELDRLTDEVLDLLHVEGAKLALMRLIKRG